MKGDSSSSETIAKFGKHEKDVGGTEVQIALLTDKIKKLSEHGASHPNDKSSRRGMLQKVEDRKGLLSYLKRKSPESYTAVISSLDIRK